MTPTAMFPFCRRHPAPANTVQPVTQAAKGAANPLTPTA